MGISGMVRAGPPSRFEEIKMRKPLYPEHGMEYDLAMMEAEKEYQAWVNSRKGRKQGITVYTRKQEDADANL
jgi:hypothetical protein